MQVGDRVVALPEFRAWAELCAVPTKYVYKIPDEMSFQDAAAITMNYLVGYIIVFELLSLRPGKSLMLHSAGGGVVSANSTFNLENCHHRSLSLCDISPESRPLTFSLEVNPVEATDLRYLYPCALELLLLAHVTGILYFNGISCIFRSKFCNFRNGCWCWSVRTE